MDKGKTFLLTTIFCFSSYHLFQLEKFPRNNEDHEIIFEGSTGKKWSNIYIGVFLFKLSLFFSLHFSLVFLTGWWSFECGLIDLSPLCNSVIKVVYNHWNCWCFKQYKGLWSKWTVKGGLNMNVSNVSISKVDKLNIQWGFAGGGGWGEREAWWVWGFKFINGQNLSMPPPPHDLQRSWGEGVKGFTPIIIKPLRGGGVANKCIWKTWK